MTIDDLYGTNAVAAERLAELAGGLLGVEFEPHESSYRGDYYLAGDVEGEHFEVQPNRIPGDEEVADDLMEPEHGEFSCLLYVNETERADEIRQALAAIDGLEHLERDDYESRAT